MAVTPELSFKKRRSLCIARFPWCVAPRNLHGVYTDQIFLFALSIGFYLSRIRALRRAGSNKSRTRKRKFLFLIFVALKLVHL